MSGSSPLLFVVRSFIPLHKVLTANCAPVTADLGPNSGCNQVQWPAGPRVVLHSLVTARPTDGERCHFLVLVDVLARICCPAGRGVAALFRRSGAGLPGTNAMPIGEARGDEQT